MAPHRFAELRQFLERLENVFQLRRGDFLVVGEVLQPHILSAERDQDFVQLHVVVDVFLALFAFDLVERRLRDVDAPGAHELGHLPVEKCQQQGPNVGAVHIGVGHDDDAAVAQLRQVEAAFILAVAVFARFADAGADGGDHRLDLRVFEKLIFARFLHVDELAANRQDRLVTAVAALFRRASGGIALHDVKLGQFRVAFRAIGQLPRQTAASKRAFANRFARFARRFARARGREHFIENPPRDRRVFVKKRHQTFVNGGVDNPINLGVHELDLGLRFEPRIWQFDAEHRDQAFAHIVAGNRRVFFL